MTAAAVNAPVHTCGGPWRCFHCDELLINEQDAALHFGIDEHCRPGCIERLTAPETNLLLALRAVTDEFRRLQMQVAEEITHDQYYFGRLRSALAQIKPFEKCISLREVFCLFDSLEGRVKAAEFWWPGTEAPKDGTHILVKNEDPTSSGFGMYDGKRVHWHGVVHYWANPGEEGFYLSSGAGDSGPVTFTHWRPL